MGLNNADKKFMQRCLQLAANGIGQTFPNPMVGAVIAHQGRIIGEGYHVRAGEAHAEVNAIEAVKERELLPESTMYVNLEPCAHYGKTPPCAKRIVEEQIPRVVIGTPDPNEQVAGKGVAIMEAAGTEVITGVLEQEAHMLNRRFFTWQLQKRPYIILKWAQTLDGFIDMKRKPEDPIKPNWITNEVARINVHKWRAHEQAIMVGTHTAQKDNPKLNVRNWSGPDPLRIVLDKNLNLSHDLALLDQKMLTIVYNAQKDTQQENLTLKRLAFEQGKTEVLRQVLADLYARGIQTLFTEGGAALINSFVEAGLWDEARLFVGNTFFREGVKAPALKHEILMREEYFGHSKLFVFRNAKKS